MGTGRMATLAPQGFSSTQAAYDEYLIRGGRASGEPAGADHILRERAMNNREAVIEQIYEAFEGNEFPGDGFLLGSFDGCEPFEEIKPFKGRDDWQAIDACLLDAHYAGLSFFSEAGLRYFLPAYLVADLKEELATADPLFTLVHGFSDVTVTHHTGSREFERTIGRRSLVNPRRYGAATFLDYARWRLSIFTREEAKAIVAYLKYKRESDPHSIEGDEIDAALSLFWLGRAENAPTASDLARHQREEEEYLPEISADAV
jgi:hypothetical protein